MEAAGAFFIEEGLSFFDSQNNVHLMWPIFSSEPNKKRVIILE